MPYHDTTMGFLSLLTHQVKEWIREVTLLHSTRRSISSPSFPLISRPPWGLSDAFLVGFPLHKRVPSQLHCPSSTSPSNEGFFLMSIKPTTLFFSSLDFRSSLSQCDHSFLGHNSRSFLVHRSTL